MQRPICCAVIVALLIVGLAPFSGAAAAAPEDLSYYLPADVEYDPAIPAPAAHFGFEVGEYHLQHHEIVSYMRALAEASDRVSIREYGRTHGNRPLVVLTITSKANHDNLEAIRTRHLKLCDPAQADSVDIANEPVVVHLCYGVHGDESSAANAAPLVAYHLAAGRGEAIEQLLDTTIILLDPCLNPDGSDRFAHWANAHRGDAINADPEHREHNQPWPSGRTNYYFFDLNRDWLPAVHPESQGRLRTFHEWKPNVQDDFHEMGSESTYFFQPGIPERTNPLTPRKNIELTQRIAGYHAKALDAIGSAYFTEERYDDFYMGKGSTYPDLHGCIGILFEQASARGHAQETQYGTLTFPFTIRNHVKTSLSTLEAAGDMREELLEYQRDFYRRSLAMGEAGDAAGYIFTAPNDPGRAESFVELLRLHDIRVQRLDADVSFEGADYPARVSYFVPFAQPEYRFVRSMFEQRTEFEEAIFYDVSAWTLPLAFNLAFDEIDAAALGDAAGAMMGGDDEEERANRAALPRTDIGYVIDWRSSAAPAVLHDLLAAEVRVRVAQQPFEVETTRGVAQAGYGSLLVTLGGQRDKAAAIQQILRDAVRDHGLVVHAASTGLTPGGIDLGSGSFAEVKPPKVILITGDGASAYDAGEVWHELDHRLGIPVTMIDAADVAGVDLHDYTTIIMAGGRYSGISDRGRESISQWMRADGTLIALGSAASWCIEHELIEAEIRSREAVEAAKKNEERGEDRDHDDDTPVERRPYAAADDDRAEHLIAGAIFRADIDVTHPLCYGYESDTLPVFVNRAEFLAPSANAYSSPLVFTDDPLLAGYASAENLEVMPGAAAAVIADAGRGRAVLIAASPLFRGHWHGTRRLFHNALFFGSTIRVPGGVDPVELEHGHPEK